MSVHQKPLLVMYMHKVPYPLENGTNQRIYAMVNYLRKDYRLGLVVPYKDPGIEEIGKVFDEIWYHRKYSNKNNRLTNLFRRLWDTLFFYLLFPRHLLKYKNNPLGRYNIAAAATLYKVCQIQKPSLVICQKIFNSVLSTAIARRFGIPVIIDIHDLYKLQLDGLIEKHNPNLVLFPKATDADEKELMCLFDAVISIQPQETAVLRHYFPDKRIITAMHPVREVYLQETTQHIYTLYPSLLFVGSASAHNIDAIQNFINQHLDYIVSHYPTVVLKICGDVAKAIKVNHTNIRMLGRLSDLKSTYQASTLVINPVRHGSGLKIKTIDALAAGKCMVTTKYGAEGLPNAEGALVCVKEEDLGKMIVQLLNKRDLIRTYESAAYTYAKHHLTTEYCYYELKNYLKSIYLCEE